MTFVKQSIAALLLISSAEGYSQQTPETTPKSPMAIPQSQPGTPQEGVTSASSSATISNVQPHDSHGATIPAQNITTGGRTVAFPATPTPKPPPVPLTQEQIDAILLPKKVLDETSNVLSVVYNGFRRSQVDPCGCVTHQLGGLDKEANLHNRIAELKLPTVKVDAGGYLRDMPTDNDINRTKYLLKGLGVLKLDAANVGFTDLGGGVDKLKDAAKAAGIELVSANVEDNSGKLLFQPYIVKEVKVKDGSLKVGIIGVTRPRVPPLKPTSSTQIIVTPPPVGASAAAGFTIKDASESLAKHLPELRGKVDIVILLAYERREKVADILKPLGDAAKIDVVVAGEYLQPQAAVLDVNGARVVSVGFEGRQMGHLVLALDGKSPGAAANQFVEVVQGIPSVAEITKIIAESKGNVAKAQTTPAPTKLDLGKDDPGPR